MTNIYFSTYRQVFELLTKPQKKRFYYLQVLIVITSLVDLTGLALFVPVISAISDRSLLSGDHPLAVLKSWSGVSNSDVFLLALFIAAFVFFLCRSLFVVWSHWIQTRFIHNLSEDIGRRTYAYFLSNDFEEIQKRDSGRVVRELTISPQHYAKFLIMPLLLLTSELLILAVIIAGIAWYNLSVFGLLVTTIFPIAYFFHRITKTKVKNYGLIQNDLTPELLMSSTRGVFGIIDVRLRGKELKLLTDYSKLMHELNNISIKTSVLAIIPSKLFELSTIGGLLLIFYYGAFIADDPQIILPLIALYAAAGYRLVPSLSKILPAFQSLERYSYLFPVFRQALLTNSSDLRSTKNVNRLEHDISLEELSFGYKNTSDLLFRNFNFQIKRGEILGLIGKSGSGKTTLVNIIAGFLLPKSGAIRVDGLTLDADKRASWMKGISYVQQTPYLERGTLGQNIAFLEDEIDFDMLNMAIKMASLTDLVGNRDPNKIMIDEQGKNLSGGQKQRVIIARALYHKANLIILDEATSALDTETEEDVNQTVKKLKGSGITIIIVAHRYTTLKYTDRIIRLDDGKIVEETTYNKLKSS